MLRRARIAFVLFAFSTLCAAPAAFADAADTTGGDLVAEFIDWLASLVNGDDGGDAQQNGTDGDEGPEDEFNPQHLPGG